MQNPKTSIFPEGGLPGIPQRTYAQFGERFVASLIDGILIWIASWALERLHSFLPFAIPFAYELGSIIIGWLYAALMESGRTQATLGKQLMQIVVTDTEYRPVSFLQATARHFSKWISVLTLFVGYFMMLWDSRNQTLHDKIAGSLVVSSSPVF